MSVLFWIECVCGGIALLITVNTVANLRAYRRLSAYAADAPRKCPFVSVLIPARNEEWSIGACLDSLGNQEYPSYEILVLDDASDDHTAAIVRAMVGRSHRVRLITGEALPDGWYGKAFACAQLGVEARGEILIFTDADTRHESMMIRAVVNAVAEGADVVTAFPEQEMGSFAERLAVSFMLFTVWAFLPVGRVWSDPSPRFVAANGQLLAFSRDAYARIGGHAAVRRSVLDDVDLARSAKRLGLRVRLADGVGTVRTRMYRGVGEVWRGFSKNALALTGGSYAGAAVFATLLLALYVAPPITLAAGIIGGKVGWAWRWLPALLIALMVVQAAVVANRMRGPRWQALVHPFSVLFFVLILANSVRWRVRGFREWKGRAYRADDREPDQSTSTVMEES